jgi:hypothetical protein
MGICNAGVTSREAGVLRVAVLPNVKSRQDPIRLPDEFRREDEAYSLGGTFVNS